MLPHAATLPTTYYVSNQKKHAVQTPQKIKSVQPPKIKSVQTPKNKNHASTYNHFYRPITTLTTTLSQNNTSSTTSQM